METSLNCQELFTLTIEQFAQVIELGIPLEALFVLECFIQGTNPAVHIKATRLAGITQALTRKGYLSKQGVTALGKATYDSLLCGGMDIKQVVDEIKETAKTAFETWWDNFPLHDGWDEGTRKFEKTRTLRTKREICLLLFTEAVARGTHSAEQIIQGTINHLLTMRFQSIRDKKNKLTFIHNSETYLRNKDYEAWIDDKPKEISVEAKEIYL